MSEYLNKVSNSCSVCNNNEFVEDEFGCLACTECGSLSKNHIKVELDYEDQNKRMRSRVKKSFNEENDCEMEINNDFNNIEDDFTNCNTSLVRDETESRVSENNPKEKSINEIFQEKQEVFIKLTKIFYNTYKNLTYFKLNQFDSQESNFESALTNSATFPSTLQLNSQNSNDLATNNNFGEFDEIFQVSKVIWIDLINKEYEIQTKSNPMKKKFRSRKTTEDNKDQMSKKGKYKEELNKRKIKEKNIVNLDDYKELKLRKKDKVKKFIDEFDQVRKDLHQEINYENILQKCDVTQNITFEQAIHQYFTDKNLDYKTLHSEKKFDELKSNLNSDNILSLQNIIFSISNSTFFMKDYINIFKRFDLMKSSVEIEMSEIKMMKYINKEKFRKILDRQRKIFNIKFSSNEFFAKTCALFELPMNFTQICIRIYDKIEKEIEKNISHIYTHENFMISVIIYTIKLLYGLNDLPYLIFLNKENLNASQMDDPQTKTFISSLQKGFELIEIYGPQDSLFAVIKELPTLHNLLRRISTLIKKDKENFVPWESDEFKINYNSQYKENMKSFAEKIWFNKQGNRSLLNKVNDLQKNQSIQQQQHKTSTAKMSTKIKVSNKFADKLNSKNSIGDLKANNFLEEELEFYGELKNISMKQNGKKKLEVPLPCDTMINFKKKAYKFEGITPPESELMIYYFFKNYFKIDYQVLKKCNKMIEKAISEKFD